MTIDELIAEGRRLRRRTILLTPDGFGDPVAFWYGHDRGRQSPDGHRCWLCVDATSVPSCGLRGWLSIFTDAELCRGGRVDESPAPHRRDGVRLYPKEIEVLPPIDAVIARGSAAVGAWLTANRWQRDWPCNSNFPDRAVVEKYEAVQHEETPLYWADAYATLGGWHLGWPDDDWHDFLDARLLVQTYRDCEPWVEAWRLPSGELTVVQRVT